MSTRSLLGTAVGDSLGLPYEGLSPQRAARLLGPPESQRFLFGRGMLSDDTEHACITAQALVESAGDPTLFQRSLARRMRRWLWSLPAGIGLATLRALLKLSLGIPAERSGVYSAGNGAAMRSAIIGAVVDDLDRLADLVHCSTVITHSDPRAERGALAVALAAHHARHHPVPMWPAFVDDLELRLPSGSELMTLIRKAAEHAGKGQPVAAFAASIGLTRGVTGFVDHTVPVALCAWMLHPDDVAAAAREVIVCGGDTDTVAAIAGGIVAASERSTIPEELLGRIVEWPRTIAWIRKLTDQVDRVMAAGLPEKPIEVPFAATVVRNIAFAAVVLFHGFRRLFPPY